MVEQQVARGDSWWEAAENESGELQRGLRLRAAYWYRLARPDVTSKLDQKKIELRLAKAGPLESSERSATKPESQSSADQWTDLLALADAERDKLEGNWSKTASSLQIASEGSSYEFCRLRLPYNVGSSYDFHAEFVRTQGKNGEVGEVAFILPSGNKNTRLIFAGQGGRLDGLALVDGKLLPENKTRLISKLVTGRPFTIDVSVRTDIDGGITKIAVRLNRRPYIVWQGNTSSLSVWSGSGVGNENTIGVSASDANVVFSSLKVRKVAPDAPIN